MIRILGRRNSSNVRKVLWLCEELEAAYAQEDWGRGFQSARSPGFLALNPNGRIPVLVQDAFVMWESHAILRHLARTLDGGASLYGPDAQSIAHIDQWLDWTLSVCAPPLHAVFQAFRTGSADASATPAIDAAKKNAVDAFALAGEQLRAGAFICGDALTIADCAFGVHLHRAFSIDLLTSADSALADYRERLRGRPAYIATVEAGGP
ncbi:MAG: glutathione S-transferase N-terminal domain-containing protein [Pseudomonadota bacterium]